MEQTPPAAVRGPYKPTTPLPNNPIVHHMQRKLQERKVHLQKKVAFIAQ
jgi:hypothetical protein